MQTLRPALVVSLHDVSPLTRERCARMLGDLAALGITRTSLLVIPNHHRKAPMTEDASFGAWLRELAAAGHEVVLHGYYHLRTGGPRNWVTERYTAGEGEFYDLSEAGARERLERGRRELEAAGLRPCGFIAPAWLLGPAAEAAVRAEEFAYTTRLRVFTDFVSGREMVSQSLVWSVRAAWRRVVSQGWNALLARRLRGNPLVRVSLHPPDWDHPAIRRQVERLIGAALAGREPMTYEGWLARLRVTGPAGEN